MIKKKNEKIVIPVRIVPVFAISFSLVTVFFA